MFIKKLITYFTLIVLSCSSTKISYENSLKGLMQNELILLYQAHSRGFFEEISVSEKRMVWLKNRKKINPVTGTISAEEWKACISLVDAIDLKSISKLTAPSNLRHTDRVPYAYLSVIKKGDTIKSIDFDHKNPPIELKQLVEHIISMKEN